MSGHIEGLLRPAEELLSAGMFALACLLVLIRPELFLLSESLRIASAWGPAFLPACCGV